MCLGKIYKFLFILIFTIQVMTYAWGCWPYNLIMEIVLLGMFLLYSFNFSKIKGGRQSPGRSYFFNTICDMAIFCNDVI